MVSASIKSRVAQRKREYDDWLWVAGYRQLEGWSVITVSQLMCKHDESSMQSDDKGYGRCLECSKVRRRARYKADPDKMRAKQREKYKARLGREPRKYTRKVKS